MIFLIEQLAMQSLLFFMTMGQTIYYSFAKFELPKQVEVQPLWGYHALTVQPLIHESTDCIVSQSTMEEPVKYIASQLNTEQELFLTSFLNQINHIQNDCITPPSNEEVENEMLSMDDWKEEPAPVSVNKRLAAKADTRILDNKFGEQLWVIEIVGEEQGYLHVSDGSARAWVDAIEFGTFNKGDILSMLVDRNEQNHVIAKAIDLLQERSMHFAIEEHNYGDMGADRDYSSIAS